MTFADFLTRYAPGGQQYATAADAAADRMDAATTQADADSAKAELDTARNSLRDLLLTLGGPNPPNDPAGSPSPWTANGLGLLPEGAAGALQARDPSLFGLFNAVKTNLMAPQIANFVCSTEVYLFVYPERAPIKALVASCERLTRGLAPPPPALFQTLSDQLRTDDFWVPQGASSLKSFVDQLFGELGLPVPGAVGGAPGPVDPAGEAEVRQSLATFGWEWAELRDSWKEAQPNNLLRFIAFRRQLTLNFMRQAVMAPAPAAQARYNSPPAILPPRSAVLPPVNNFRWVTYDIAGSQRLTSDIDVNLRGSMTEAVVQSFNSMFRDWTRGLRDMTGALLANHAPTVAPCEMESGFVLDMNVYANDYLRNSGRRFLRPALADSFWPVNPARRADAERWQDIYALLKMRRYMADPDWAAFLQQLQAALERQADKDETQSRTDQVDNLWGTLQNQFNARLADVENRLVGGPLQNSITRAQNELYQEQLDAQPNGVEVLRWNNLQPLNDAGKVALAKALGLASFLAQEAYHTSGAVLDIVANTQVRSGVPLSDEELLCSINEQVGDIFKEIQHLPVASNGAPMDADATLEFAIETSKYMVRLGNVALNLNYRIVDGVITRAIIAAQLAALGAGVASSSSVGSQEQACIDGSLPAPTAAAAALLNDLLHLQTICGPWRTAATNLLAVKDDPDSFKVNGAWNGQAQGYLNSVPGQGDIDTLKTFLIALAAASNAQIRGNLRRHALSQFLGDSFAAAVRAARALAPAAAPRSTQSRSTTPLKTP